MAVKRAVELEEKFVTEQSPDFPNEGLSRLTLQKLNNIYKFIDIIMDNGGESFVFIRDNDGNTVFNVSRKFYYKFGKNIESKIMYVSWAVPGLKLKSKILAISQWTYERIQKFKNIYTCCKYFESRLLDYFIKSNGANISHILLTLLNQPEILSDNHDFSYIPNLKLSLIELVFYISIILEESVINKDMQVDQEISNFYSCQKLLLYKLFDDSDQINNFVLNYKLGSCFNLFKRFVKAPMFFKLIKSLKEQQLDSNDPKIILALDDLISLELIES